MNFSSISSWCPGAYPVKEFRSKFNHPLYKLDQFKQVEYNFHNYEAVQLRKSQSKSTSKKFHRIGSRIYATKRITEVTKSVVK